MINIRFTGYYPGHSILHTARALTKVFLAVFFIFASAIGNGFSLFAIALFCHLGMLISGVSISDAWKRLVAMKTFLIFIGGMPLFFTPGTQIHLFDVFFLPITVEGFQLAVFTISRIVLMIWISMILVWTTSPESLMKIVAEFGARSFPRSNFLQEFFLIGVLAFQNLPCLIAKAEKEIGDSWKQQVKNRKKVNLLEAVKGMVRLLIVWVVKILTEPDQLNGQHKKP